jgi:hypothetical protein
MALRSITIDISPAGTVKVEAHGFQGKGCAEATEQIEIVLGGQAKKTKKKKPEFFASPSTGQTIKRTF